MKTAALLIFLTFFVSIAISQQNNNKITTSIIDENSIGLATSTVELLRSTDSLVVKITVSDKNGVAEFENIKPGTYLLRASNVKQLTSLSGIFEILADQNIQLPPLKLKLKITDLKEITVSVKRPFLQKFMDKTVINVENSITSAGSSAMEVLEHAPGINIDQNDLISMRGRQGVIIMIDGKITPMTGQDLTNYLRSIPSSSIDKIDLISNPSSKYDAAGNSGIIDIHFKKDQRLGANGTLNTSYGQGKYMKANMGLTFNYKTKKINLFGNLNDGYQKSFTNLILVRDFYTEGGIYQGGDYKDNLIKAPINAKNIRIGSDLFLTSKTVVGALISGNFTNYDRDGTNNSTVYDNKKAKSYTFNSSSSNHNIQNNLIANLNFRHTFPSKSEITADIDFGKYYLHSGSFSDTRFYNLDNSYYQQPYILAGDQIGGLNFLTEKIDFSSPTGKSSKIDLGVKVSDVFSDNDVKFYDMSSGVAVNDVNKTNHFIYTEKNFASYLNFNKELKKVSLLFGLRGEETQVSTEQLQGKIKHDTSYFQLFPSGLISYKINDAQKIGLSASRRIQRVSYNDLNPFIFLIDVSTFRTGNPHALPELTWNYELNYFIKRTSFTFGYSHTIHNQNIIIAKYVDIFPNTNTADNVTVQIPINLSSLDHFGFSFSTPIKISNWWNITDNADLYYNRFNGQVGKTFLNSGRPTLGLSINNNFTFRDGWSAEFNSTFSSPSQYGFQISDPIYIMNTGIQKQMLSKRANLKLSFTDIFLTNVPRANINYLTFKELWWGYRDTRVATLAFTYRFGKSSVQAVKNRRTGSDEEMKRASGS